MISRLVTRTVLVSIITALVWALWWTWTAKFFQDTASRVELSIIESSVCLAALSLLIESFLSFGTISVKRGSWWHTFSGIYILDEDRKAPSINARTCELFGVRSVILSMFSIMTAMSLTVLYQVAKVAVLFLFNPYVPAINWHETLSTVGMLAVTIPLALLLFWGQTLILKKIGNMAVKVVVSVLYWSVAFGVFMGIMTASKPINDLPVYIVMLIGTGVMLGLASVVGAICSLGYLLYRAAGKASQRFPVLQNVWNQFCPIQTVRFLE